MEDEIKKAIDKYIFIVESEENQKRKLVWKNEPVYSREKFRRIPGIIKKTGIPIIVDVANTVWASVFNFNMKDFYTKPEVFLLNYLKIMEAQFELGDDTTFSKEIPFAPTGSPFAASLFGIEPEYDNIEEPHPKQFSIINEKSYLEQIDYPDFFNSGQMPLIHRFYEEINELLIDSGCHLVFPNILRSPYGIATQIRGFENLAFDLMDDPVWIHKLMRFLTDSRKKWYEDRSIFLKEPVPKAQLYNDEIDGTLLGPDIYENYVLEYEKELSEFHGGVNYWHSCGNINSVLKLIRQIPHIDMIKISAWNDYKKAAEVCRDIPLEFGISAVDSVTLADGNEMAAKVKEITEICITEGVESFYIRTEPLQQVSKSCYEDINKAGEWVKSAREIVTNIL